jgi:hypothetical protein
MHKNWPWELFEGIEKPNQIFRVRKTDSGHGDIHALQSEFVRCGFFDIVPGLPGLSPAKIDNAPNVIFSDDPKKLLA